MSVGITREKALDVLNEYVNNPNMIKHCLASEAVLGAIAEHLGKTEKSGRWQDFFMTLMLKLPMLT